MGEELPESGRRGKLGAKKRFPSAEAGPIAETGPFRCGRRQTETDPPSRERSAVRVCHHRWAAGTYLDI